MFPPQFWLSPQNCTPNSFTDSSSHITNSLSHTLTQKTSLTQAHIHPLVDTLALSTQTPFHAISSMEKPRCQPTHASVAASPAFFQVVHRNPLQQIYIYGWPCHAGHCRDPWEPQDWGRGGLCSQETPGLLEKGWWWGGGGAGKLSKNLNAWGEAGPKTEVRTRKRNGKGDSEKWGHKVEKVSGGSGVEEKGMLENNLRKLKRFCQMGKEERMLTGEGLKKGRINPQGMARVETC